MISDDSYEEEDTTDLKQGVFKEIDLNKFELEDMIGEGSISKVYRIQDKETNDRFAAKIIRGPTDFESMRSFFKEIEIMQQIDSPFVLKYIGHNLKDFEGKSHPVLITEYMANGTLTKLLRELQTGLTKFYWDDTKNLTTIYGIALGMARLHSKGIIHRDLKPENIFIDEFLFPKIADFGLSILEEQLNDPTTTKAVGTPVYMAPEVIQEEEMITKSIDVYSFAMVVYEIMTHQEPFGKVKSPMQLFMKVTRGERPIIPPHVPESYRNLISRCWDSDPQKRPTFDEIVEMLRTDKGFLEGSVDEDQIRDFILEFDEKYENDEMNKDQSKSHKNKDENQKVIFEKVHIEYPEVKELLIDLDPIDLALFTKLGFVGDGTFGKVFKIREKKTNEYLAAKVNKKNIQFCEPDDINNLTREIIFLSKLKAPSILKFIGYNQKNFKDKPKPTIVTEFSPNGSLEKIIELINCGLTPKEWTKTKVLISMYGIAAGMSHMHSKNILHRDLKPANVIYDKFLFPKICDFGLSKEIHEEVNISSYQVGTPIFMSPEILVDKKYSKSSDVYAYAFLVYQMITLEAPYKGLGFSQLYNSVVMGKRPTFNCDIPECYKELIERCWCSDYTKRPSFDEILDLLENDENFITDEVDENEFFDYISYIKSNKIKDSFQPVTIDYEELKKIQKDDPTLNISYYDLDSLQKGKVIRRLDNFKVYEVINKKTEEHYEAKVSTIKITKLPLSDSIHLQREINILSKLDHPSFLRFIGYSPVDFNRQPLPIIITEKPPNRSLEDLLNVKRSKEKIDEWNDTKKLIEIFGVASGMAYLHSHNVIHRNLTPESIFLDDYLFPKIGNFGLLRKIHSVASMTFQTTIGIKENFSYSSPELLENNEYSKQSDVYSFALVVYEIMTLNVPFKDQKNFNNLYNEVVINSKRPSLDDRIPERYRQLIEICWSQDPEDRPTFEEIMSILKNDDGFITKEVDKKAFKEYVKMIEESQIKFYSVNRVVNYDDIIKEKSEEKIKKSEQKQKQKQDKSKNKNKNKISHKSKDDDNDDIDDDEKPKSIKGSSKKLIKQDEINDFETITNLLSSKKFVGYVKKEFIEYLLKKSIAVDSTLDSTNHKIKIDEVKSNDDDFILLKILKDELFIEKTKSKSKEAKIDKEKIYDYVSELKLINVMNHPNIVKTLAFFAGNVNTPPSIISSFYSRKIKDVIKTVDEIYLVCFVYEIGHAMRFIHSRKMIHRNLNLDNIFIDSSNHVKMSGFGISVLMNPSDQIKNLNEKPFCVPKEILSNDEYNEKVDAFSFGVIMEYILLRGKGSFLKREDIIEGKNAKFPITLNKLAYTIIKKCLSHSQNERLKFSQITHAIKKHNFMLIDGIEEKIPILKNHLSQIIINRKHKKQTK